MERLIREFRVTRVLGSLPLQGGKIHETGLHQNPPIYHQFHSRVLSPPSFPISGMALAVKFVEQASPMLARYLWQSCKTHFPVALMPKKNMYLLQLYVDLLYFTRSLFIQL